MLYPRAGQKAGRHKALAEQRPPGPEGRHGKVVVVVVDLTSSCQQAQMNVLQC